jgi:hypothetical protein
MPLLTPSGRVYAFYVRNTRGFRTIGGQERRADMLGDYVCKVSDDGGRTWSERRWTIPLRETEADRGNDVGGDEQFFWGVGKPMSHEGTVWLGFSKIGKWLVDETEGWFLRSDNVLTAKEPSEVRWTLLPDGDVGLRAPAGSIAEEHNLVALSDGSLYCTYRTVNGHLAAAYSRDGGRTWTPPAHARYSPEGRVIKNPRGPAFVRKFSNGKYLLLYYNYGGKDFSRRNPYWLSGGIERDGYIHWSEPEICLYDDDPAVRIGYPDFIEDGGQIFISETNKVTARVHPVDWELLRGLWRQHELAEAPREGRVAELGGGESGEMRWPDLGQREGFTLEAWLDAEGCKPGDVLLDAGDLTLSMGTDHNVVLRLTDGEHETEWASDPGGLAGEGLHHVVAIVDGGPKIISYVIDGKLCDGGESREFGWTRFDFGMGPPAAASTVRAQDSVHTARLYARALRTSEAVGSWRAGATRRAGSR